MDQNVNFYIVNLIYVRGDTSFESKVLQEINLFQFEYIFFLSNTEYIFFSLIL